MDEEEEGRDVYGDNDDGAATLKGDPGENYPVHWKPPTGGSAWRLKYRKVFSGWYTTGYSTEAEKRRTRMKRRRHKGDARAGGRLLEFEKRWRRSITPRTFFFLLSLLRVKRERGDVGTKGRESTVASKPRGTAR